MDATIQHKHTPPPSPRNITTSFNKLVVNKKFFSWAGPLTATAIAAYVRLPNLANPREIIFDETYYAKEGLSLAKYGHEKVAKENADETLSQYSGTLNNLDIFTSEPAYVAHPPFGKWVIASGELIFGPNPFGWRIAVAILGILSVLILARTLIHLTNSIVVGTIGGLLLALDGIHIVMSRTALLDMVLSFLVLLSFALLVKDKKRTRKLAKNLKQQYIFNATLMSDSGPSWGLRPYRILALISLGLAIATKWSGAWFLIAFLALSLYWDWSLRKKLKIEKPLKGVIFKDLPLFSVETLIFVPSAYLATWAGWIFTGGWGRDWATINNPISPAIDWFTSLLYYHSNQLSFHTGLTEPHTYQAGALGWLFQIRPTSFYYENPAGQCGADICSSEVLALGNPVIWWAGILAIVYLLWLVAARQDWRAAAILLPIAAGWLPWLYFSERPTFTFYTVAFVPFLVMAIAYAIGKILHNAKRNPTLYFVVMGYLILVVVAAWWFLPIWNAEIMTYEAWRLRMWFPSWI